MKTSLIALTLLLALAPAVSAQEADTPQGVVEALFRAMKAGDADRMGALLHADVRLVSTSVKDGAPVVQVVGADRWLAGVRASTRELDERIYDVRVQQEAGLATVWAGYDLFVDGAHSHCGVDAFQLVRTTEGWRIIDIADTRRTEGCPGA